ncbi:MAG: flagellar hook basal-body protein, partial [Pseudolabrys sp.]|nr:flagellar hook basal-body protein [Pseudolabrys sp.]
MGIFGALTTAVTGMRAQAYALENISGNIANSQTTAFKRIDTSFEDLIPDTDLSKQLSGSVVANSRATNTVQGDIQASSISTFMAINGAGFFVVQKPTSFTDNRPVFSGTDMYSRRGDFQLNQNGYLVNGAGYYLSGIPIDATTGNLVGSVPQTLQFQNCFLPAVPTSEIDYRTNLASYPLTADHNTAIPGSELLNPANFSANPINGAPTGAKIIGSGAALNADASALETATQAIGGLTSAGGTLNINGTNITIAPGANAAAIVAAIHAQAGTTKVDAALDSSNHLQLTSADAKTNIVIGNTSTLSLLNELGLAVGTTNATNLLTQGAATPGQTLTITIGGNPTLTLTFGTGGSNIETLGDLNTALAGLTGGVATADPTTGNLTITAAGSTDTITVGGDATALNFGIHTRTGIPSNGHVVANDVTSFLNESVGGGAVTAYDVSGSAVNIQLRWAKVDSASLGSGHSDTWNLFYQNNPTATGTQSA